MKLISGILFFTVFNVIFLSCQKEHKGYFEMTTSVGGFYYTNQTTDPNDKMEMLENLSSNLKLNFLKSRKDLYYMEVRSTADSSVFVEVSVKVYYKDKLVISESNSGYNQPSLLVSGHLND